MKEINEYSNEEIMVALVKTNTEYIFKLNKDIEGLDFMIAIQNLVGKFSQISGVEYDEVLEDLKMNTKWEDKGS